MWVARDKDGSVWLFTKEKPIRNKEQGIWEISEFIIDTSARLNESSFSLLTWEDEPIEVEINYKGAFDAIYKDLKKAEDLLRR